jgi:hypothetical protein
VKSVAITAIICVTTLGGAFLWMTPYRYDNGGTIRVHRITGRTEMFYTDTGWITPAKYVALEQERKRKEAEVERIAPPTLADIGPPPVSKPSDAIPPYDVRNVPLPKH